ncbi:MAG: SDR family oxidoreductase [Mailhella sp.]|nr:SDR family oxidoreductase [Mailhella sp.]
MPLMLILGATSEIARSCALRFAQDGWDLCLAGRRVEALHVLAQELRAKTGRTVTCEEFDALACSTHATLWASIKDKTDAVLCAVGFLGDQMAARHDEDAADRVLRANFTGLVPLLSMVADTFEQRQRGLIIGISSVAGDRGRGSNYLYGSAKAGFSAFLSGLRARLAPSGVHVLTVKPGLVASPMIEGRDLPRCLIASPETVARDIAHAVRKKRHTLYCPWYWRGIMFAVKHLPERLFIRLKS